MNVLESPILPAAAGIRHGYFGRQGGESQGVYASLNCGYGSSDETGRVRANRTRAAGRLGTSEERLLTVYQIHSGEAAIVERPWARENAPKADAMATRLEGIALGILAADCAPVLFADRQARVVGAAHAGWKGALDGVLEAAVAAMERLGAERGRIHAAIGPCIGQASYEVGPEFCERFLAAARANGAFFRPSPRTGHWQFDLPGFVRAELSGLGLAAVDDIGRCTYARADEYFSYRRATHRGEADYGRNLSAIMLVP